MVLLAVGRVGRIGRFGMQKRRLEAEGKCSEDGTIRGDDLQWLSGRFTIHQFIRHTITFDLRSLIEKVNSYQSIVLIALIHIPCPGAPKPSVTEPAGTVTTAANLFSLTVCAFSVLQISHRTRLHRNNQTSPYFLLSGVPLSSFQVLT